MRDHAARIKHGQWSDMRGEWRRVRGMCRAHPPAIYILGLLSICGFVTTVSGGVCGCAAPPWEVGFGLVGGWDFRIRVYVEFLWVRDVCSSPHGSLL